MKLSLQELEHIAEWFTLPSGLREAAEAIAEQFDCATVCVTRGAAGAGLWHDGAWVEHAGYEVEVRDTVGAGDAFLAVLVAGILSGTRGEALLEHANLIGAYVATQDGAVPYDQGAATQLPPATAANIRNARRASS